MTEVAAILGVAIGLVGITAMGLAVSLAVDLFLS